MRQLQQRWPPQRQQPAVDPADPATITAANDAATAANDAATAAQMAATALNETEAEMVAAAAAAKEKD